MRTDEIKEVMGTGEPVVHRGITYSHVSAIIQRKSKTGFYVQVELTDKNKNSVAYANPSEVARVGANN